MADMTNVDAGKLRQSASRIGSLAGELSGNVNKINETINNLSKSWVSEAATRFLQNWRTDEEALKEMVDQYNEVSIGFPIWYGTAPNVVNTFCKGYDWSGKKVRIFTTSGGSGIGKTAEKLQPYIKGAEITGAEIVRG